MTSSNLALSAGLEDIREFDDEDLATDFEDAPAQPQEALQGVEPTSPTPTLTQPTDALQKSTHMPPKLVEDVQDNPELLRPVARSMAAINLHNLFVAMQHPRTSNKDRMDFQTLLNKLAGLEAKAQSASDAGPGFSINIVLPGHKKELTIEGTATKLANDE